MASGRAKPVEATGVVTEQLPHALFRVALDGAGDVVAHAADDPHRNFMRLLVGDRVQVELTANDPRRGRITRRLGR